MLSGLGEMGKVETGAMNNAAGGQILFEVELSGAEADLRSVLSLVVPEDAIQSVDGKPTVFVVVLDGKGGARLIRREVEPGARSGGRIAVIRGLTRLDRK